MPRTARASVGDMCYHAINRGNGRQKVFHTKSDYEAFVELLGEACRRLPMRMIAYCVMPNHFHLALWPYGDGDLSRWMQWLLTAHVRRYHRQHGSSGHVWQGRFKAFPIQDDEHLFTVLRYIERNPLRAGLVKRAEQWQWSSLHVFAHKGRTELLHPGPVAREPDWVNVVNASMTDGELEQLRRCVKRGAPFGSAHWAQRIARRLGLESSLKPLGRPTSSRRK